MKATSKIKIRIKTRRDGYVHGVRCGQNHSGNHGLCRDSGAYQCQGCGAWFTADQVIARLAKPGGAIGTGGVISG